MVEYKRYDRSYEDEVLKVFTEAFAGYPLFWGVFEVDEALVDLNARHNAFAAEEVDKVGTVVSELAGGFVEENYTINVFFEVRRGEENIAVVAAMLLVVRNVHRLEFLVD